METPDIKNQPSYKSKAALLMSTEIDLHYDLMAGTKRLRSKPDIYLPRLPVETADGWADKTSKAALYNAYGKTISTMGGLVLRRDPQIQDNGSPSFVELLTKQWENITSSGMHGKVFLQNALENQFAGHVFIVVDFPPKDKSIIDKVDESRAMLRPYWSLYTADQALNWRVGVVDNKTVLTQITFREIQIEADGEFGEAEAVYYRRWQLKPFDLQNKRMFRAAWTLYREVKQQDGSTAVKHVGEGVTKLTRLPIAIAYGLQKGIAESRPPLADLAYKNIEHFQDYADYRKGKSIAGIAFLWTKGLQKQVASIGWDIMFEFPAGQKDEVGIGFVEAGGSALAAQRLALEDLKGEMSELGMALLIDRAAQDITATEAIIDHSQRSSALLKIADSLKDAVEQAIEIHGEYLGYPKEAVCSIDLGYKPEELVLSPQNIDLLFKLYDNNLITGKRLLECFKGGGSLPDDMDIEKEIEDARAEMLSKPQMQAEEETVILQGKRFDNANKAAFVPQDEQLKIAGYSGDQIKEMLPKINAENSVTAAAQMMKDNAAALQLTNGQ